MESKKIQGTNLMAIICSNCGGSNYDENDVCLDCGFFVNGLPAGTLLDNRYEIKNALKAGGMGAVYLAFDNRLQQNCAVKEMFNITVANEQQDYIVKRFMEEAKLLAGLNHPSIPRVIDYFPGNEKYYLVMDYIKGRDLYTYIFEEGGHGLREELVLDWAIQVCDVLDYLHSQPRPILHRDLKPSNLIHRDDDGRIILIDFGLARAINPQSQTQKTVVGTLGYAPMEQYQGHPEPRSDVYSLGATMHFLLSAQESMPFKFPPIKELRSDVSIWMERVIQKALSLKPENRFTSAEEMYRVLIGEISMDELVFNPDDVAGLDIVAVHKDKPSRGLKPSITSHRPVEEPIIELKASDILNMAKVSKEKRFVEPLTDILITDPLESNRRKAASFLCNFGDERAVEPLIKALKDKDSQVRSHAAWSLGKLGDTKSTEALLELYENDEDGAVKRSAREALKELGGKRQTGDTVMFLVDLMDENFCEYKCLLPDNSELYLPSLKELLIEFIKDNDRLNVRFHLGIVYYARNLKEDALKHFERAEKLDEQLLKKQKHSKKRHPEILCFIGKVLLDKRKIDKAIEYQEKALKFNPSYTEAQGGLIEAYYERVREDNKRGLTEDDIKYYDKIITSFPDHGETDFFRGLLCMKQKNIKEACKYFRKYLEEHPEGTNVIECEEYLKILQKNFLLKIVSKIKEAFKKKDNPKDRKKHGRL
ncbi:MAG: Serine/threonine-protein kinase C [bacterium ADurb.Bin363]|nr:MAG: Serine/threonine-protein kinase C [bacterium ADurb.Bin363]